MTPWNIIGWALVWTGCALGALVIIRLLWALAQDLYAAADQWRAHRGKVRCQAAGKCNNPAAYLTPNGYFCDYHRTSNNKKKTLFGSVSWSTTLDWAKE